MFEIKLKEESMNSILKWLFIFSLVLCMSVGSVFAEGQQEPGREEGGREFIRFGGGSPGGSWFPTVGGLASILAPILTV